MPRYRPESPLGYDLSLELAFVMIDGRKCQVGSANSIMLMCPACGRTKFRMEVRQPPEECFGCGSPVEPVALEDLEEWNKVNPIITTVEQRKARRLEDEALRPWNWVFGNLTEANFPDGFAEIDGAKVPAYTMVKG